MLRSLPLMAAIVSFGCSAALDSSDATYAEPGVLARGEYDVSWADRRQGDTFGTALVLQDDELIVGAPAADLRSVTGEAGCVGPLPLTNAGRVLAFAWEDARWRLRGELDRGVARSGDGVVSVGTFGTFGNMPLARSDDLIALGVPSLDLSSCVAPDLPAAGLMNGGAVFLFERSEDGKWRRTAAPLLAPQPREGDFFGVTVAFHEDRLYVGATGSEGDAGVVRGGVLYVLERRGERWEVAQLLLPSRPIENGLFGNAIAADGDWLAIGAFLDSHAGRGVNPDRTDELSMSSGAVYLFERSDARYVERAYVKAPNSDADDNFGLSLALSNDALLVGAPFEGGAQPLAELDDAPLSAAMRNAAEGAGAVYEYRLRAGEWQFEKYLKAPAIHAAAGFGLALRLRGERLLVSAPWEDGPSRGGQEGLKDSGAAYLYSREGDAWRLGSVFRSSTPTAGALFGTSVDLDERRVAIGAPEAETLTGEVHTFALER